jgi:hypothetical protein
MNYRMTTHFWAPLMVMKKDAAFNGVLCRYGKPLLSRGNAGMEPNDISKGSFVFRKDATVTLSLTREEQAWKNIFGHVPQMRSSAATQGKRTTDSLQPVVPPNVCGRASLETYQPPLTALSLLPRTMSGEGRGHGSVSLGTENHGDVSVAMAGVRSVLSRKRAVTETTPNGMTSADLSMVMTMPISIL